MEWLEKLNKTISYIEEHLAEEISYDELAHIACCSTYHFQRMFAYMAGIPLSEYIRRRRLTLAANDIRGSSERIIDIAIKYGYDSADSFSRAFTKQHGITPSEYRKNVGELKIYPPASFYLCQNL